MFREMNSKLECLRKKELRAWLIPPRVLKSCFFFMGFGMEEPPYSNRLLRANKSPQQTAASSAPGRWYLRFIRRYIKNADDSIRKSPGFREPRPRDDSQPSWRPAASLSSRQQTFCESRCEFFYFQSWKSFFFWSEASSRPRANKND